MFGSNAIIPMSSTSSGEGGTDAIRAGELFAEITWVDPQLASSPKKLRRLPYVKNRIGLGF